ncbi:uncharacterized protein KD926_008432 [Aspergillus affinis]|uniref:uncharacterized protein n=1 Tax=Aspergillus affinis TaxID=1070780 RepID=UPI0022FE93F6|nr:uncharacterized protein KD926_008432 [Aspergillus affinis]KAI9040231.1 hypothetical protein KD926_008432 [Aspergillus affinis]
MAKSAYDLTTTRKHLNMSEIPRKPDGVKLRVLCLHGIGTNCEIFEAQTAALRYQLRHAFNFEFIGGEHPWPAARGIAEVFGRDEVCYSYFDGTPSGALSAVEDLADYVAENGPFDAIMGFSLGATLSVMFLFNWSKLGFVESPFKFAILLSSCLPCDWDALQMRRLEFMDPTQVTAPIKVPTIHCWSPQDTEYPGESRLVMEMCDASNRVNLQHSAGHNPPTQPGEVDKLAQVILDVSKITTQPQ